MTPPSGEDAFSHWLHACGLDPWEPLTPEAAKPYRFIWQAWLKFLAGQDAQGPACSAPKENAWTTATPEQVLAFLNTATRSQKQLDLPTDITRRRYWRILDRIYAHAQLHDWVTHNPAAEIASKELPPSEDPKGAILAPDMWNALRAHIPQATDLISARDRAVLMLLMELGITSEEMRGLRLEDVCVAEGSPLPVAMHIEGTRERQTRELLLSAETAQALQTWLGYRAGYAAMQGQPALFCTRKAPELTPHTVLHLVTKTIRAASQARALPPPPRLGPQAIRNTVIVQWLRSGLRTEEVLHRAGLKSAHALWHLKDLIDF